MMGQAKEIAKKEKKKEKEKKNVDGPRAMTRHRKRQKRKNNIGTLQCQLDDGGGGVGRLHHHHSSVHLSQHHLAMLTPLDGQSSQRNDKDIRPWPVDRDLTERDRRRGQSLMSGRRRQSIEVD